MQQEIRLPDTVRDVCRRQKCSHCRAFQYPWQIMAAGVRRLSDGLYFYFESVCRCGQPNQMIIKSRPLSLTDWAEQVAGWMANVPSFTEANPPPAKPPRAAGRTMRQVAKSRAAPTEREERRIIFKPVELIDCVPGNRPAHNNDPCSIVTLSCRDGVEAISLSIPDTERLVRHLLVSLATAGSENAEIALYNYFSSTDPDCDGADGDDDDDEGEEWKYAKR